MVARAWRVGMASLVCVLGTAMAQGADQADLTTINRIVDEGFNRSEFVEKLIGAGFAESHDELIQTALEALSHEIETSARNTALEEGCPNAESASLEELADMLGRSDRRREN